MDLKFKTDKHVPEEMCKSIDEVAEFFGDVIERKKLPYTCNMCKNEFDAVHITTKRMLCPPVYDDSKLHIQIRKDDRKGYMSLYICPECTEKLLDLLDTRFPRLNLEDEENVVRWE